MKSTVNLNDMRRMRLLLAAGMEPDQAALRLHIQPSVVRVWFEKLKATPPPEAPPGDMEAAEHMARRSRRKS